MTLMSIPDAAHIYRVPESSIRRWISEGRLLRHGDHRPYGVDARAVEVLAATTRRRKRGVAK